MTAAAVDLCTLAMVHVYLGIPDSDTSQDDLFQQLITAASRYVVTRTGQLIKSATYTQIYNGTGTGKMMLRVRPIISVASVQVRNLGVLSSVNPVTGAGMGYWADSKLLYAVGFNWPQCPQNIEVTYTAGYTTVPEDLAQAVVEMVAERAKHASNEGVQSKTIAGETIVFTDGNVPRSARNIIDLYASPVPVL